MKVCFFGHHEIADLQVPRAWLAALIPRLLDNGADTFFFGGYGAFGRLAASFVWDYRTSYRFQSILVKPYLDRSMDEHCYHSTLYPELEYTPKRFAIVKRNQWMVNSSDIVVAYVLHSWGGAAKALEYAEKRGKHLLIYPDIE